MNLLDSPLESFSLDHLSLGFLTAAINNIWTWVAVLTATVTFLRTTFRKPLGTVTSTGTLSTEPVLHTEPDTSADETGFSAAVPPEIITECTTRRGNKFVEYYSDEDDVAAEDDDVAGEVRGGGVKWEMEGMLRMRILTGEGMGGWYYHQDLTEINGNVVRLWDTNSCRKRSDVAYSTRVITMTW